MHSLKDIMMALGFNPDSPSGAQEAFYKNLVKEARSCEKYTNTSKTATDTKWKDHEKITAESPVQLSFDLPDFRSGKRVS